MYNRLGLCYSRAYTTILGGGDVRDDVIRSSRRALSLFQAMSYNMPNAVREYLVIQQPLVLEDVQKFGCGVEPIMDPQKEPLVSTGPRGLARTE